jgi:hypothetical protein
VIEMRTHSLLVVLAVLSQSVGRTPPASVFAALGLTQAEIAAVDAGRPVAKVLSWGGPSEVYVFGAVHIAGSPERYLRAARDVGRLNGTPGYLGAAELSQNPTEADLRALSLEPDDVQALRRCREDACDVQLPTTSIEAFRDGVDFSTPDALDQANALARPMMLRLLRAYQSGGNAALGDYRDKKHPARVSDQFDAMMERATVLPDLLPELRRYLLDYPKAALLDADSFFYWEKVDFGLKPTIRLNHAVIYRGAAQGRDYGVVAIKQLYATHYFHTALDVSVCVDDGATGDARGFYLMTIKGSQQEGLTGVKGGMLRKVVVDRTRGALERSLGSIKRSIEQPPA